jgi:hypothetical protein
VTTAAFEIHPQRNGPDGIIDITGDQSPAGPSGAMNGIIEQQQIMQQAPPLFDMDLERMQTDLFKGRYITPRDFLEDVYKMVHNAEIRAHEDQERLHKAQAMYTAAEVSIQEFDPLLAQDCDRMAPRERQRREERRKEREKNKAKEINGMIPPVGARRSARANGLQPELTLTDPVKLERRLKRQRGEDVSDSHGSEAEAHVIAGVNGGRDAKRSRLVDEFDDDRDPLDTLGSSRPGTATRLPVVRFAPPQIEPMAPLMEVQEQHHPYQPNHLSPQPSLQQSPYEPHHYNQQPQAQSFPDQMVVDYPPRRMAGFNPALLNPILPSPNFQGQSFPAQPNAAPFNFPTAPNLTAPDPSDPFHSQPHPQYHTLHIPQHNPPPMSMMQLLARTPTPPPPGPSFPLHNAIPQEQAPPPPPERFPTPLPEASSSSSAAVPEPTPMVVERSPTPPLPEFHVSQFLLSELYQLLKDRTAGLSIEQLEQLRATSLGTVWRHRKEWNRDALVQELLKDVREFIEEVGESDDE